MCSAEVGIFAASCLPLPIKAGGFSHGDHWLLAPHFRAFCALPCPQALTPLRLRRGRGPTPQPTDRVHSQGGALAQRSFWSVTSYDHSSGLTQGINGVLPESPLERSSQISFPDIPGSKFPNLSPPSPWNARLGTASLGTQNELSWGAEGLQGSQVTRQQALLLDTPVGVLQRTIFLVSFASSGTALQTQHIRPLFEPTNFLHNKMPFPYALGYGL